MRHKEISLFLLVLVALFVAGEGVLCSTSFHSDPFDSADAEGWWGSSKTGSSTYIYRTSASGGYFGFQGGDSCGSITLVTKDLDVDAFVDTFSLDIVIYSQTPSTGGPYNLWIYVTYVNGTTETLWDHMNYASWTSLRTDTLTDLVVHGSQLANITVKLTSTTAVYSTSTKLYVDNFVLDTETNLQYSNVTLLDGDDLSTLFTIGANTVRYYAGSSYLPMTENPTYFYTPASYSTQSIYVLTGATDSYTRVLMDGDLDPIFIVDSADEVSDYLISIVDSSNTIVIMDVISCWALDGEGNAYLVDQDAIDYAKLGHLDLCYSHAYYFAVNSTEGTDYEYGLATVTDNPAYLVFDLPGGGTGEEDLINGSVLVPQNISIIPEVNFTAPTQGLGEIMKAVYYSDFGIYALMCLPALIMLVAGRYFGAIAGAIASGLCVVVNVSLGFEFYSYSVLGWISAIVVLMVITDLRRAN